MFVTKPPERAEDTDPPDDDSLLSLRSAMIIFGSLVVAIIVGVLTFAAAGSLPVAALAGGGAFPGTMTFLHKQISRRS
ncbi:hypothetical protein AB0F17_47645 [Nonomuraea sp. NPDC026600]|uniref:hypothetical protein n=1 Tax=Nonomuraea sp. NPDC026600 TaxID=3155363 RepID=UPI0034079163